MAYRVSARLPRGVNHVVFGRVTYEARGRRRTTHVVTKVYGDGAGGRALATMQRLWNAGFRPPARHCVPRVYGYSTTRDAVYQSRAPGITWAGVMGSDKAPLGSRRAAAWLIRLQRSPVKISSNGAGPDVGDLVRSCDELAASFPGEAATLKMVRPRLVEAILADRTTRVPSHGDYHPENVVLSSRLVTVVDLDTVAPRSPAFDVGYAIGQLLVMSQLRFRHPAPGAAAAMAFWDVFERRGAVAWPHVAVQVARTLLQSTHYELCDLRTGRTDLLPCLVPWLPKWLDSKGPETLGTWSAPR